MGFEAQHIKAPDGTDMVVLKTADYESLLALAEEGGDRIGAQAALQRIAAGEGVMPDAVLGLMFEENLSPLGAWRRFRGLSQAELARRSGVSQVWVGRIETGGGRASDKIRGRLAEALEAPFWSLATDDRGTNSSLKNVVDMPINGKYRPLSEWLETNGSEEIRVSFEDIDRLVSGLPPSAFTYPEWWQNNRGHGQALGWRSAGYIVKADLTSATATFTREL